MTRLKRIAAVTLTFLLWAPGIDLSAEIFTVQTTYNLVTPSAEKAIDAIIRFASGNGGYVKSYNKSQITLRIPAAVQDKLRPVLLQTGYISDENIVKQEVSQILADYETSLKVKKEHLNKLYGIFTGSGIGETLEVEKEIARVVMEIEKLKGQINWYRDRALLSGVTIRFLKSGTAGRSARSSGAIVDWVKGLGIENLMRAY